MLTYGLDVPFKGDFGPTKAGSVADVGAGNPEHWLGVVNAFAL